MRIWCPKFNDNDLKKNYERVVSDVKTAVLNNQTQMNSHPFEFLFLNLNQNRQSKILYLEKTT